jgi:DNA-binding transcriptional LysR family regulator
MNIDDVRAFVAVVDNGSVGKAALRLHVTQPAITRRVQRLEETLGLVLLDRDSKPAKPSRAGESIYQRCLAVLRATDELAQSVTTTLPAMPLRVGLSYAISECVFATALEAVREHQPDLKLQLTAGASPELQDCVSNGTLDAAVVLSKSGYSPHGPHVSAIGEERVAVVAAKSLGLPLKAKMSDLVGHSWIINPNGCGFRSQLERALAEVGSPLNVIAETWGNSLQLAMVARGDGLALVPERMVHTSPYRDRLQIIQVRGFEPKVAVSMIRGAVPSAFSGALDIMTAAVKSVLTATAPGKKRKAEPRTRSGVAAHPVL